VKIYRGKNSGQGGGQAVVVFNESTGAVRPLRHIPRHSPDGFQWGYGGSGPSDLALSILADAVGLEMADRRGLYQLFKDEFIARAGTVLEIREEDVLSFVALYERKWATEG